MRVHPVTGWKSVFVNPGEYNIFVNQFLQHNNAFLGFTLRILNVSKGESDHILHFLYTQMTESPDFQVRYKWDTDDIAFWDNRVCLFGLSLCIIFIDRPLVCLDRYAFCYIRLLA